MHKPEKISGGSWLGAIRTWIQWTFPINGSDVTWNSDTVLRPQRELTPALVEKIGGMAVAADRNDRDTELTRTIETLRKAKAALQSARLVDLDPLKVELYDEGRRNLQFEIALLVTELEKRITEDK